jgi:hypothetical protein
MIEGRSSSVDSLDYCGTTAIASISTRYAGLASAS